MISTPWGEARIVAKTPDGGFLVCIAKKALTEKHPDYYGGPCINFIYYQKEK